MERIAVTGATGRLGGRVARRLTGRGFAQRLLVRSPRRAPQLAGASIVVCRYERPEQVRRALAGVETVLMISAPEGPDRLEQHRSFIDAAASGSVARIVYVSLHGASPTSTLTLARDHAATEEYLRSSGLTSIVLRDNLYLDGGDPPVAGGAADDAVRLDQLGQEPETLTRHRGRTVSFHAQTVADAYASRAGRAPEWQLDAWVSTYTAIAAGELARVTDAVPVLTGHPALTLDELLARPVPPPTPTP